MTKRTKRHDQRRNGDKLCSQILNFRCRIVNIREKSPHEKHDCCHNHTAEDTENNHLVVCVFCLFQFSGSQILSHNNTDTRSQLYIDNVKQIGNRRGNIQPCHHIKSAHRIALGNGGHARRP